MNLIWHIVKKDLRALKWPLLVWTLLIVAKLGVGVAMLTAVGTVNADWFANWFARMDTFSKVLAGLECVSFVLVAAVVHEDLLVGTTAFWMTRPISGARLLCAKILGIGLIFFVLPVIVTLPWWLGCGFGPREIAWAALETIVVQAICVLLGLLWAVVTDGFARFLMWTLVLVLAVPSALSVIGLHISNLKVKPTQELFLTRIWMAVAIAVLAIMTVVVHQFLTRRTWRSVGMICSALGLMVIVGAWWPWDMQLKAKWNAHIAAVAEADMRAELSAEPAGLKFIVEAPHWTPRPNVPVERLNQVQTNFSVDGVPDNRMLSPQRARFTLHWADGTTDSGYGWIRNNQNPFSWAASQSHGLSRPPEMEGQKSFTSLISLPAATLPRAHTERPKLTVNAVFRLLKFDSAEKLPLQPGARILNEAQGERVAHVETMDGQILITYIKSRPDFVLDDKLIYSDPWIGASYSYYGLVNQAAGKFDFGSGQLWHKAHIASVAVTLTVVAYGNRSAGRKSTLLEPWLRDAELIRQTFVEDVRFSHELDAGSFPD